MEGTVYIPFTIGAKINNPPVTTTVTIYIESSTGRLSAKKSDGTVLVASAGADPILFA